MVGTILRLVHLNENKQFLKTKARQHLQLFDRWPILSVTLPYCCAPMLSQLKTETFVDLKNVKKNWNFCWPEKCQKKLKHLLTWVVSEKDVAAVEIGSDEEESGRKAGSVNRQARQLHECYYLKRNKHCFYLKQNKKLFLCKTKQKILLSETKQ